MTIETPKIQEIRIRIKNNDFPHTRAEAIKAETFEDYIGAGLFWGLISAPRRHAHYLAYDDVEYSSYLLKIEIPEKYKNLKGLQLAEVWYNYLKTL